MARTAPIETPKIHPVILSGGSGTRLWPMSREAFPKQLLRLTSGKTLLQETALRVAPRERFHAPLLVCNAEHRFIVAEQLQEIAVEPRRIVLEPEGRNTAAAVAVAALALSESDPEALMLLLPSDHVVADTRGFQRAVAVAARCAADGALATFGITPTVPETGYGYIRRGHAHPKIEDSYAVDAFIEKPDRRTAEGYLVDGRYYWNSGMFLFRADVVIAEFEAHAPAILDGCRKALEEAEPDLDFLRLAREPFVALPSISIDYAVMEHTTRAAVVPADFRWNDVGSWAALWQIGAKDAAGNAVAGDVVIQEVRNSLIRNEGGPLVAALGLDDIVIVATDDAVLVAPKARAEDVRQLVDMLKRDKRHEATEQSRVYRPWGFYQSVHEGERFQVKRITVNVGGRLSLQSHHHRSEHWVVVSGTAKVTRGADTYFLGENESTYIPPHTLHRLENPGKVPLHLIEVQTGSYLGEDDIQRHDDAYGRG